MNHHAEKAEETKPLGLERNLRREIGAGTTTFVTAAYIIFVNPSILATTGMDKGALVTVTCLASGLATLLMGLWGRAPIMLAPGMGLNAFFAFGLCQMAGVTWEKALGVVFISGVVFFLLALVGLREKLLHAIPKNLRFSISVGIGLFIAFIGLKQMGLVTNSEATLVTLGPITQNLYLGLGGLFLMAILQVKRVPGAFLIAILATTLAGMWVGDVEIPSALFSAPHSMAPIFMKLDISGALTLSLVPMVFAFMYVDLFDSLGTFMAVMRRAGLVDEQGQVRRLSTLLKVDCLSTIFGALMGTSTITAFVESAAGVAQGGRTGMTSVTTGVWFLLAMFFAPIIMVVPPYATAPALIIVGLYMLRDIKEISFKELDDALPAFLVILLMPLTFSISHGIMFGFLSYVGLKVVLRKWSELNWMVFLVGCFSLIYFVLVGLKFV